MLPSTRTMSARTPAQAVELHPYFEPEVMELVLQLRQDDMARRSGLREMLDQLTAEQQQLERKEHQASEDRADALVQMLQAMREEQRHTQELIVRLLGIIAGEITPPVSAQP